MFFRQKLENRTAAELLGAEQNLADRLRGLQQELEEADADVGGAVIDWAFRPREAGVPDAAPALPGPESKRALALRTEISGIRAAIDGLRRQRVQAVQKDGAAEAAQLRRQAEQKRGELQEIVSAAEKALAGLAKLENLDPEYGPFRHEDILLGFRSRLNLGGANIANSERLQDALRDLEQRASEADKRTIRLEGRLNGTLEQVAETIYSDPTVLYPDAEELLSWADRVERVLRANEPASIPDGDMPRLLRIRFKDGRIDEEHSVLVFGTAAYGHRGYMVTGRMSSESLYAIA